MEAGYQVIIYTRLNREGGLFNLAKRITGSKKKEEETDKNYGSLLPVLEAQ